MIEIRTGASKGKVAYGLLLVVGTAAAAFHAMQDRWAQAIVATIAIAIGIAILVSDWREVRQPADQHAGK